MNGTWHLITGEYPPQRGGVSDYTWSVATGLADADASVHVWAPQVRSGEATSNVPERSSITVHRLRNVYGDTALHELTRALDRMPEPRTLIVQYVPHAFGARGMNFGFCRWVQRRARTSPDDVRVMFHEPYYPFVLWPPHHDILALANRLMAVLLLSDTRVAYVATPAWGRRLARYAPRTRVFTWLPVPALIPRAEDPEAVARWRSTMTSSATHVVGHFGTFGRLVGRFLEPTLEALLAKRPDVHVCLIGRQSDEFRAHFVGSHPDWNARVTATGLLPPAAVSACLQACDVVVQPYADGASGRRTTLMAALVNRVAAVTNRGVATEPDWDAGRAVAFARQARPAALCEAVERLLDDAEVRGRIAAAGAALYDQRFALRHTVAQLLAVPGSDPV